jgi:hypothetical protein
MMPGSYGNCGKKEGKPSRLLVFKYAQKCDAGQEETCDWVPRLFETASPKVESPHVLASRFQRARLKEDAPRLGGRSQIGYPI